MELNNSFRENQHVAELHASKMRYLISEFLKIVAFGLTSLIFLVPSPWFLIAALIAYELNVGFYVQYKADVLRVDSEAYRKLHRMFIIEFALIMILTVTFVISGVPLMIPLLLLNFLMAYCNIVRNRYGGTPHSTLVSPISREVFNAISVISLQIVFAQAALFFSLFSVTPIIVIFLGFLSLLCSLNALAFNLIDCRHSQIYFNIYSDDVLDEDDVFPTRDISADTSFWARVLPCCNRRKEPQPHAMRVRTHNDVEEETTCWGRFFGGNNEKEQARYVPVRTDSHPREDDRGLENTYI